LHRFVDHGRQVNVRLLALRPDARGDAVTAGEGVHEPSHLGRVELGHTELCAGRNGRHRRREVAHHVEAAARHELVEQRASVRAHGLLAGTHRARRERRRDRAAQGRVTRWILHRERRHGLGCRPVGRAVVVHEHPLAMTHRAFHDREVRAVPACLPHVGEMR
jgi:hypothetical protein